MEGTESLTIGQWVAEKPSRSRVFERLGIDYCCGGNQPLERVCAAKNLQLETVIRELNACDDSVRANERNWQHASLTELADHIERTHHAYLKRELPRLAALITKVTAVHGHEHPELRRVDEIFHHFELELSMHMQKEEMILFPMCRQLEAADSTPNFHCGSISNPIRVMESEHDNAGEAMSAFRQLTGGYKVPSGACRSYQAMLSALQELEEDMHRHVHEENNILFPRAIAMESNHRPCK